MVHGLEQIYDQRIDFYYLDVDDPATDSIKRDLVYYGLPTVVLLDGEGNIVKAWTGLVSQETFINAINEELSSGNYH